VSRAPDHLNAAAPQRPVAQRAQIIETNKWFQLTMYYTKRFATRGHCVTLIGADAIDDALKQALPCFAVSAFDAGEKLDC
jgi:hypothetical protein